MRTSPNAAFTAAINNNKPLIWSISIGGQPISTDRIPANSISLKAGTSEKGRFTVGAVVISELSFSIDNNDGHFDNISFDGAEVIAKAGFDGVSDKLTIGTFYVDSYSYGFKQISVSALDKLRDLDKSTVTLIYPTTVDGVIAAALNGTGITKTGSYQGGNIAIAAGPEYALTRRQALSYALEISGNYGRMNYDGKLLIGWYAWATVRPAPEDWWGRELQPKEITITGAIIAGQTYGAAGYLYDLSRNPFVDDSNKTAVSYRVLAAIRNRPFLPGSIDIIANPLYEPGDIISMPAQHSGDTAHSFVITSLALRAGLRETLVCDAAEPGEVNDLRPSETKAAIQDAVQSGDIGTGGGEIPGITGVVVVNSSDFDPTASYAEGTLVLVLDDLLT